MNAAAVIVEEFVEIIVAEISAEVDVAVGSWMAQVEEALHHLRLRTLGRMNSGKEVLARYKSLNGKTMLTTRGQAA